MMDVKLHRVYNTVKAVLIIMPFVTLLYLYIGTPTAGLDFTSLLQGNPLLALTFLIAMIQPFIVLMLGAAEKDEIAGLGEGALVIITLLLIAECMMRHLLGIVGLIVLFYLTSRKVTLSGAGFKALLRNKQIWGQALGGLVILLLAALCLFIALRIG